MDSDIDQSMNRYYAINISLTFILVMPNLGKHNILCFQVFMQRER